MIRVLAMIAGAGLLVSAVTLASAVVIAGPEAIANGGWQIGPHGWRSHWSETRDEGPQTTREIAFTPSDKLNIELDGEVQYSQGPAKLTVTGPKGIVDDVELDGNRLHYAEHDHSGRLTVVISAPSITDFTLGADADLSIAGYKQDRLRLAVDGDGQVKAAGETKALDLDISGSGHADLAALKTATAKVDISGSGDAKLAPTDEAEVDVSGSGDVSLLTDPPKLHTNISGSGTVRRKNAIEHAE